MEYHFLGRSGLRVSELCFGVMSFNDQEEWSHIATMSQADANNLVDMAIDKGINIFDTADIYAGGRSEEMLGQALKGRRDKYLIATKFGFRMGDEGPNGVGLSRKRIVEACEASLKRLQTDYIDLYQIHSYDFITPIEETLQALNQLIEQGKVRYIGCSNFTGWQLMKAMATSEKYGNERLISLQAYYSLLGRDLEFELVPVCQDQEIGIMVWSPLHGGVLTGKYHFSDEWPDGTRIQEPDDQTPYDREQGEKVLRAVKEIADERGVSLAQVSLNYLLRKQGVSTVVIGAQNEKQLKDNLATVDWKLSEDEVERLNEVSEPYKPYPHWYFDIFRKEEMDLNRYN
ncbi:MAG: aldo/keto reductase [Candidatus Marinimicrobia bacterium]|nr:aldo/keto reductase [Candidatus Neomarinimicrobiota bacterium]MCF7880148.1 aldo/keto reductase [Candidatus Neomarinimicrobiota bacterium]